MASCRLFRPWVRPFLCAKLWFPKQRALVCFKVWSYFLMMAKKVIRTTYALDEETVDRIDRLARTWGVSRSEALRRAVAHAAHDRPGQAAHQLRLFRELQESLSLTEEQAEAWIDDVRQEREAWEPRRK